ncbi:hypothetical protein VCUG_00418 [Vavraia culicis subsp. floridensis]|uniref:Cleavage and polyadenylation specificity factor subunit 2 n=1 Tax=Vavraia culicis (isolate floridensis) TaxID=948595 RepID=L2GYK1_VAVCU|nr:uncharacterized protein VCUG_00418 [Vavraia culicis subsp. floridensis]ELA48180.1 hypothetical protein VCUG_00418 [Vavraia culicis subsp. floridensis]
MPSKSFYSLRSIANIDSNVFSQLLEIDTYKILINIGSDPFLKVDYLAELERIIDDIDCILICHAELKYIGGLPSLGERFKGKLYCSVPVHTLGRLMVSEVNRNMEVFGAKRYEEDDIEEWFARISVVKYSQPIELGALRLTAHNSGHSLGGCLWQISKDNENVVVAFDINHRKENHVDGLEINNLRKNFIFLMNCEFVGEVPVQRKSRDSEFMSFLAQNHGNKIVILCTFSRYLEICSILDEFLERKNKRCTFLSFNSNTLYESFKIMLEWAGDIALKKFTNTKVNPFAFKNIRFKDLYSEVDKKTDIFVILDENLCSPFTNRIVYDLNDERNVLVVFNDEHERTITRLDYMDVPEFKVEKESDKQVDKSQRAQHKRNEPNPESVEREKMHIVVRSGGPEDDSPTFPVRNKQRPCDSYGEFFDKKLFLIKAEEKDKEVIVEKPSVKRVQETISMNKLPFSCRIRTKYFNFNGLSDGNSVKTILESLEIEKLILLGKNKMFVDFFYYLCHYNHNFGEICVLTDQVLNLSTDITTTKVNLEDNFLQKANFREINGKQMASFKGCIKDNVLYYKEPLKSSLCLGSVKMTELKKQLLDNNLRIKKANEKTLVVEDQVKIVFNDGSVRMVGEMNGVYLYVRRIIYNNLYFIN